MTEQAPEEQHDQSHVEAEELAAIAVALASGASVASIAAAVSGLLASVAAATVAAVVRLAMAQPVRTRTVRPGGTSGGGTAGGGLWDLEPMYRAAYLREATRRVEADVRQGVPLEQALVKEQRFYKMHIEAQRGRFSAVASIDRDRRKYGALLGWYATLDARTSPECRAANGKNFNALEMPRIGYPGAVHPHCRCKSGKPHANAKRLPSIRKVA